MCCELPAAVARWLQLVEGDEPRACKEQHALCAYVRRVFETEDIWVDLPRLECYLHLARYFPFRQLFPWQEAIVALWLCTFRPDGLPRWKTFFGMLARGGGKDGFIAFCAFCLTSPYNPVPRYNVDICANNEDQATRPVADLVDVLESPGQEAKLSKFYYHTKQLVQGRKNKGTVIGHTNNPAGRDGLRSGCVIFNEAHQYENYKNINVFETGLGKVAEARVGIISSNGAVSDGPLDDYLTKGRAILFEGEDDGGFLPFICWPPRNSSQRRRQAVIIGEIAPTQNNIWIDNSIRTVTIYVPKMSIFVRSRAGAHGFSVCIQKLNKYVRTVVRHISVW